MTFKPFFSVNICRLQIQNLFQTLGTVLPVVSLICVYMFKILSEKLTLFKFALQNGSNK